MRLKPRLALVMRGVLGVVYYNLGAEGFATGSGDFGALG